MGDSDAQLLERARAGDSAALDALLELHQAQIYRFGLKMCRDPEDARDVMQETMIAMARGVRDFRGASSLSTWLYQIARSFCIKKRRKSKFAPTVESSQLCDDIDAKASLEPQPGPEELLASKRIDDALQRAIRELDPKYREVLLLRDVEGLTAPEVAEVLQLSPEAVKSRLHRARLGVRAHVASALGVIEVEPRRAACPDVLSSLSRHWEGEISAEACLEMERHVDGCASCRQACESLKRTLALCYASGPTVEVPKDVQEAVRSAVRRALTS